MANIKKYKLLIFSFCISAISVYLADSYFKLPHYARKNFNQERENIDSTKSEKAPNPETLPEKAMAVVIANNSDQVDQKPIYKIILPKGKRLYNEEAMKDVAEDANIETLNRED